MTDTDTIRITRTFDATASQVWRMWTDPDELAAWFHAAGMVTPRSTVDVDLEVGGRLRYTMVDGRSGSEFPTGGVYLAVEPTSRLSFTWGDPDEVFSESGGDAVVTIALRGLGARTELSFEMDGVPDGTTRESVRDGWVQALDGLESAIGSAP